MGLFATIKTNKKCPKCNKDVEWQSKYIVDKLGYIVDLWQEVKLEDIAEGEVYTFCDSCNLYVRYEIKNGKIFKE